MFLCNYVLNLFYSVVMYFTVTSFTEVHNCLHILHTFLHLSNVYCSKIFAYTARD